jgi:hypothetical protein
MKEQSDQNLEAFKCQNYTANSRLIYGAIIAPFHLKRP